MLKFFMNLKKQHQVVFAIVMSIAVVAIWRGVWGLMDWYLFPTNPLLSYLFSIVIGFIILMSAGAVVEELTWSK